MAARGPEPNLDVEWQRHIPAGVGKDQTERRMVIHRLASQVERTLRESHWVHELLDDGDLVVTISRRPAP